MKKIVLLLFVSFVIALALEGVAKLQFGAKSALLPLDSNSSQIAYPYSDMSICEEIEPMAKSSNLASKASFATPSSVLFLKKQGQEPVASREFRPNMYDRYYDTGPNLRSNRSDSYYYQNNGGSYYYSPYSTPSPALHRTPDGGTSRYQNYYNSDIYYNYYNEGNLLD